MGFVVFDLILGALSLLSIVLAFVSQEYRIFAVSAFFILLIIVILSSQSIEISKIKEEQKKTFERLKIYERLSKVEAMIKVIKNG